jgi:hypothetical protein
MERGDRNTLRSPARETSGTADDAKPATSDVFDIAVAIAVAEAYVRLTPTRRAG